MIVYSKTYKEECEVFGIAMEIDKNRLGSGSVTLYIRTGGQIGLGSEPFDNSTVINKEIGNDFKAHYFINGDGIMILWDFFTDIDHLARLIDLDPETVTAFEAAYASRLAHT